MGQNQIFLSVIVPCYNESENLAHGILVEIYSFLQTLTVTWELIISDDGSTDNSRDLVEKFITGKDQIRLLKNHHGGKPTAIHEAVKIARGKYLLFTDMDQSTPLTEITKFFPYFDQYEVVIGSRSERKNFPWYRKLGSAVFKSFRRALLLRNIHDTQCGFKAFKTDLAQKVFPKLGVFQKNEEVKGWKVTSFDVELLHLVEVENKKIKEIPVEWEDRDLAKGKNRKYGKESIEMIKEILRIKRNDLLGVYRKSGVSKKER